MTGLNLTALTPTFSRIDPVINYPGAAGFIPAAGFGNAPPNPTGTDTSTALIETGYLNIVRAVQCSIPTVVTRVQALRVTARSAAHAMCDWIKAGAKDDTDTATDDKKKVEPADKKNE